MDADHLTADSYLVLYAEGHIQAFLYHGRVTPAFLVADLNLIGTGGKQSLSILKPFRQGVGNRSLAFSLRINEVVFLHHV